MTPGFRAVTDVDLSKLYDVLAPQVVDQFNTEGELPPALLIVTFGQGEGEVDKIGQVPAGMMEHLQRSDGSKDMMMGLIAALLQEGSPMRNSLLEHGMPRPDVIVHLTEAWHVPSATELPPGSLSEHPERQEAVLVVMHTAMGTHTLMMPADPATRKVALVPFAKKLHTGGRMQVSEWLSSENTDLPKH